MRDCFAFRAARGWGWSLNWGGANPGGLRNCADGFRSFVADSLGDVTLADRAVVPAPSCVSGSHQSRGLSLGWKGLGFG